MAFWRVRDADDDTSAAAVLENASVSCLLFRPFLPVSFFFSFVSTLFSFCPSFVNLPFFVSFYMVAPASRDKKAAMAPLIELFLMPSSPCPSIRTLGSSSLRLLPLLRLFPAVLLTLLAVYPYLCFPTPVHCPSRLPFCNPIRARRTPPKRSPTWLLPHVGAFEDAILSLLF